MPDRRIFPTGVCAQRLCKIARVAEVAGLVVIN